MPKGPALAALNIKVENVKVQCIHVEEVQGSVSDVEDVSTAAPTDRDQRSGDSSYVELPPLSGSNSPA